jgi:hypothetical protein
MGNAIKKFSKSGLKLTLKRPILVVPAVQCLKVGAPSALSPLPSSPANHRKIRRGVGADDGVETFGRLIPFGAILRALFRFNDI